MERRNAWLSYTEAEEKELEQVAKAYRNFLNVGKTERECVTQIIREARAAGSLGNDHYFFDLAAE